MNTERTRISVAVLISVVLHGAIALLGVSSTGPAAHATRIHPVAVTIVSTAVTETRHPMQPTTLPKRQQRPPTPKPNEDAPKSVKTQEIIPANTPPTPKPEADPSRAVEAATALSEGQFTSASQGNVQAEDGHTEDAERTLVPTKRDVTAMPLYHLIPKPAYPSRSRDLGEEGQVIIAVLVSEDGGVLEAYVSESSGYPLLDGSALAAVTEKWRFKPGMRSGKAVPSWVRVPIIFSIEGG